MSAVEGEWRKDEGWRFYLFTSKHLLDSNIFRDVQQRVFDGIKADEGVPFHAGALRQEGIFIGATETHAFFLQGKVSRVYRSFSLLYDRFASLPLFLTT